MASCSVDFSGFASVGVFLLYGDVYVIPITLNQCNYLTAKYIRIYRGTTPTPLYIIIKHYFTLHKNFFFPIFFTFLSFL